MRKMYLKLAAACVCTAVMIVSTVNAGAASTENELTGSKSSPSFNVLDEKIEISGNQIYTSAYNVPDSSGYRFVFNSKNRDSHTVQFADLVKSPSIIDLEPTQDYVFLLYSNKGGGTDNVYRSYKSTGGTYRKIRIKLSDFSSRFNSDGSQTKKNSVYGTHVFKFGAVETTSNAEFYSALCIRSGAAFTAVTPDENGEVEFYVSTDIGIGAGYCTDFRYKYINENGSITSGSDGGTTGGGLIGLDIGDTDSNGSVNVSDVTKIQMSLARLDMLNNLQQFTADTNSDGKVSVIDCAYIQMHLAKK